MRNNPAEKACHNCRRRRLKCDRTVPGCKKCEQYGVECLGYKKLFLWEKGVASRGKMMGKTFPIPQLKQQINTLRSPEKEVMNIRDFGCMENSLFLPAPLTDPFYQGLDYTSRLYVHHFATRLSVDMVISDISDTVNPFRSVVPLCRDHPILLHTLVANAAFHISELQQQNLDVSNAGTEGLNGSLRMQTTPDASFRANVDALSAKHKALVMLRRALQDISNYDVDLIITVIHLFIISELISPCQDEWMSHVQGALRLIGYLQTLESRPASPAAFIRDSVTSDCLTYYVLGSTLMNTATLSDPFSISSDITASLTRAEANSYLSLPTPLLQILFKACELSNLVSLSTMLDADPSTTSTTTETFLAQARNLLDATTSFNIYTWASILEGSESSTRALSRIHTALAHKNAVQIYIIRSVDCLASMTEITESLVAGIIENLSLVPITDPVFKATCWPAFIAGAETDNPVYRRWAQDRLREFWELIPWGYVRTAGDVMMTTWRLRDAAGRTGEDNVGKRKGSWVQQLKGLQKYWLIA
ncbi:Zn(II)2Cys6 transcription factor [Aspergillus stella-maris]|uniref:Zn(II)2Cys6 transcription factor n=1 Tax=Aspergillus stella-maris TaxID=1810926 RepID=UPI003CCD3A5D